MSETIEVSGKKPIAISFTAPIQTATAQVLVGAMVNAVNSGHDEVHFLLSTPGGSVVEGINLYNLIRTLPVPVHTYNIGNVNSIGNVVYLAGTNRFSATISSFMFHGVGFDIAQGTRLELKDLKERISSIKNDQSLIAKIVECHTNLTVQKVGRFFLQLAHVSAQEALDYGITHKVCDIRLPKGIPIQQLVFQG